MSWKMGKQSAVNTTGRRVRNANRNTGESRERRKNVQTVGKYTKQKATWANIRDFTAGTKWGKKGMF